MNVANRPAQSFTSGVPVSRTNPSLWSSRRRITTAGVTGVIAASMLVVSWMSPVLDEPVAADAPAFDGVAATESEALAEAAASGQPVEILSARSERRDVDANPDGTLTATEYTEPTRTLKNGTWVATDATLQVLPDGSVAPIAATVDMVFSGGGTDPLARLDKAGKSVSFGWNTSLPTPVLNGTTATYSNVLPDVDLVISTTVTGFSHTLVVKTPEAAASPDITQIDIPITTDGTELRTPESGGVEILDAATGGIMFAADTPAMWDSGTSAAAAFATATEDPDRADVDIIVAPGALTLTPDQAMLTNPATVYPVYIDPVYTDEYRSGYAMVDSGYATEEYWKFDGKADEGLGRCPLDSGTCGNSQVKQLYYQFGGLTSYKGRTIISAEFAVNLRFNWRNTNTDDHVKLYKSSGTIGTGTNWNNRPSGTEIDDRNTPTPSGGDCKYVEDGPYGTEFDVRPEMQGIADAGNVSTLTLGMRNADESDGHKWMRFCHSGHLRIHYNTKPSTPSRDYMTTDPGGSCANTSATTLTYANKLPKLSASIADPDADSVAETVTAEYRVKWGSTAWQPKNADGTVYKAPFKSTTTSQATAAGFTLDLSLFASQLTALPENTVIHWDVRGVDKRVEGDWSADCYFVLDSEAPDPPKVLSSEFPSDETHTAPLPMLGEYGSFTFDTASTDVTSFTYEISGGGSSTSITAVKDLADNHMKATVRWVPDTIGLKILTVTAFDASGQSQKSSKAHIFRIAAPATPGVWDLTDPAGSTSATDGSGLNPAVAGLGAVFGSPGPKAPTTPIPNGPAIPTAVHLDGSANAYLEATQRDLAPSVEGFAVGAWVNTGNLNRDQTAVSINGGGEAGFTLGFDGDTDSWVFSIPDYDIQAFSSFQATAGGADAGEWVHLLGVYDAEDRSMRLYVNGVSPDTTPTAADQATRGTWWNATGPVQIGRRYGGFGYTDNWEGDIAEVKLFNRVVFADEAAGLMNLTPIRTAYWQFNDQPRLNKCYDVSDAPELAMDLGNATVYSVEERLIPPYPLMGLGHLELNGVDASAYTTQPVVDVSQSFAITMRVLPASIDGTRDMTAFSVPGPSGNLIALRYNAADQTWAAEIDDKNSATPVTVTSAVKPNGEDIGQFIAVTYDAFTDTFGLYVNGSVGGAAMATSPSQGIAANAATLQLGRQFLNGTASQHFSGVLDDVRTYEGVVDIEILQSLADPGEQPTL